MTDYERIGLELATAPFDVDEDGRTTFYPKDLSALFILKDYGDKLYIEGPYNRGLWNRKDNFSSLFNIVCRCLRSPRGWSKLVYKVGKARILAHKIMEEYGAGPFKFN